MVAFDFKKKEHRISKPLYPSGNIKQDMMEIHTFFKGTVGKVPEYSFTTES